MMEQAPDNVVHPSILFSTIDIETTYEEMKNNGVKVNELLRMPYGKCLIFTTKMEISIC